jgi:hypothetical protein
MPLIRRSLNILERSNSSARGSYKGDLLRFVKPVTKYRLSSLPHLLNSRMHWTKKLKYLRLNL